MARSIAQKNTNLEQTIRNFEGRFSQADLRLADMLLSNLGHSAYLSANQVAREAGVHPTSAVRFARKLGYRDYSDLREQLRQNLLEADAEPAKRVKQRLSQMTEHILVGLVQSEIRALEQLPQQVTQEQIEHAVRCIQQAKRIVICGTGHASALVELLSLRLERSGYNAIARNRFDWRTSEAIAHLAPNDTVVIFALRRSSSALESLLGYCAQQQLQSVVISDQKNPSLRPNVHLSATRGAEGESQSLTVPMTICNAIILELARLDNGQSVKALDRIGQVRHQLKWD